MRNWGSWEWLGADLVGALNGWFDATVYEGWSIPSADVVVIVKHRPPPDAVESLRDPMVLYFPVDAYASVRQIIDSADFLGMCDRIVVHSHRLFEFFAPYAPVELLDHHLKYLAEPSEFRPD
jgi:hypothetical protein